MEQENWDESLITQRERYNIALIKGPQYFSAYTSLDVAIEDDTNELEEVNLKAFFGVLFGIVTGTIALGNATGDIISNNDDLKPLFIFLGIAAATLAYATLESKRAKRIKSRRARREAALTELDWYIQEEPDGDDMI